jgi:hypothetical protein
LCRKRVSLGLSTDSAADSENLEADQVELLQKQLDEVLDENVAIKFRYLAKLMLRKAESDVMGSSLNSKVDEFERRYGVMERTAFGLEDEFAVPFATNETMEKETQINVRELQRENSALRKKLEDCERSFQISTDSHKRDIAEGIAQVRRLHEEIQGTVGTNDVPETPNTARTLSSPHGGLMLRTPPATIGRQELSFFSHGPPMPPPPPDCPEIENIGVPSGTEDMKLCEWLEVLRNEISNRPTQHKDEEMLQQLNESRARAADLEHTVMALKEEHQHRSAALEAKLAAIEGVMSSLEARKKDAGAGAAGM